MKELVIKDKGQLRGKLQRQISVKKIAVEIIKIMKTHIGFNNAISKKDLFKALFKEKYVEDRLDHWMLWQFTKRAMHQLRSRSNCFIGMANFKYFVLSSDTDANYYISQMDKTIKKMRQMQKKAQKSVDEKWHKQIWSIDYQQRRELKWESKKQSKSYQKKD